MKDDCTQDSLSVINRLEIVHCMVRSYDSGTLQLWAEYAGETMSPLLEFSGVCFMTTGVEFFHPRFRVAGEDERAGAARLGAIDAYTTVFAIDATATDGTSEATYLIAAEHIMPMHRVPPHSIEKAER